MIKRKMLAIVGVVALSGLCIEAQQVKPDNTAVNKRDQNGAAVTSDQQPNTRSDLETTRAIRRALTADKSLSTYAHNVKVVTQKGRVTLRGPVKTDVEKQAVETKAAEIAGAANVTNQLSIASSTLQPTHKK